jgi:hypothetical protein
MRVSGTAFLISGMHWRYDLRQEPDAGKPHVRIRAGGRPRGRFLPRHSSGKIGKRRVRQVVPAVPVVYRKNVVQNVQLACPEFYRRVQSLRSVKDVIVVVS